MTDDAGGRSAEDEVVGLCRDLLRIDTTNTGEAETSVGERAAAECVAGALAEVGVEPTVLESEPRRTSVVARVPGADRGRPALLIHGDDLRHDIEQEGGDDAQRDDRDQRRIDERERKFLSQHLPGFKIVREPGQDFAELARLGADGNETPIQIGEGSRKTRHRGRQRLASCDLIANRFQEPRGARMVRLLGQRRQRLVERHS